MGVRIRRGGCEWKLFKVVKVVCVSCLISGNHN